MIGEMVRLELEGEKLRTNREPRMAGFDFLGVDPCMVLPLDRRYRDNKVQYGPGDNSNLQQQENVPQHHDGDSRPKTLCKFST